MAIKHKKAIIGILLCLTIILSVSLSGCTSPAVVTPGNGTIKIVDSSGKTITFDKPAERIIVMGSDQAEILIAIGAGDKIVGVVNSVKNNPTLAPLVKNVTDVGAWDSPNIETILSQRPDVVVAYASYKPKNLADFEKQIPRDLVSANYKWREKLDPACLERIRAEAPDFYAQHEEEG